MAPSLFAQITDKEKQKLLIHSITTTSEARVHEYLAEIADDTKMAFVLTSRMPDDESDVRYDVFMFVKDEEPRRSWHNQGAQESSQGFQFPRSAGAPQSSTASPSRETRKRTRG